MAALAGYAAAIVVTARAKDLKSGNTKSCGLGQCRGKRRVTHGHMRHRKPSPTYMSWQATKQRCLDPNHVKYPKYGALGVTICDRWKESFENFLADLGERLPGTTLGRFDDIGNYEPSNCKWMTSKEQRENWRPDRNMGFCKKIPEQIAA